MCRDTPHPGQCLEVGSFHPLKRFLDGSHDHLGVKELIKKTKKQASNAVKMPDKG